MHGESRVVEIGRKSSPTPLRAAGSQILAETRVNDQLISAQLLNSIKNVGPMPCLLYVFNSSGPGCEAIEMKVFKISSSASLPQIVSPCFARQSHLSSLS
jgi:hypothetical protein